MLSYKRVMAAAIIILPILTPAHAKDKPVKTPPVPLAAEPRQAHEFFAYLMKLNVVDITTEKKCYDGKIIPHATAYIKEPCASILRVSYSCNDGGKETHTTEMKIDWRYVSEIELSGYSHDGEEIKISGNITTSHTEGIASESGKANKGKLTRKAKLTFDSPATAKRALNAFTLLKKNCDTSADYPF
jgi:hypothetical protein